MYIVLVDAEKTRQLEKLEDTVARLEMTVRGLLQSLPHPIPSTPSATPAPLPSAALPPHSLPFTPQPPSHSPPRPLAPLPSTTPQPPQHSPPRPAVTPQPLQRPPPSGRQLSSDIIHKSVLSSVSDVVQSNPDLVGKEGKMGTMAVILAREAFFGEEVMGMCTAKGYGDKPGLPLKELMALKQEMRNLYPQYTHTNVAFEDKWLKCLEAISQTCKHVRTKQAKKH